MAVPKNKALLEAEVRTWTEDISDAAILEMMSAALKRPARISRDFDIPYAAGYSSDGRVIYIDRHMPSALRVGGRRVPTDRFIALHEIVEKALLDGLRLHYLHAHQVALRTEQAAVRAAGLSWRTYDRFTKKHSKEIAVERLTRVPAALDLTPYSDEEDFDTLDRLVKQAGRT
ncbi:MAG TPA: hypothetical protein VFB16_09360 [Bauldia sp.]|nr:hypothetical protein [Bauldia sp.]